MTGDVVTRAREALEGAGESGMYDDYDQACLWSGLVTELVAEVGRLRGAVTELRAMHEKGDCDREGCLLAHVQCIRCDSTEYPCDSVAVLDRWGV